MSTEVTDGEVSGVKSTVPTSGGGEVPGRHSTSDCSSQAQRDGCVCVCAVH